MKNLIFKSSFREKLKMLLIAIGLMVTSLTSQMWAGNKRIYCKCAQSWWKTDGAAVAAHYWGGTGATTWPGTRMTALSGESDTWYIDVPDDNTSIIFVRVNGSGTIADWGAKTGDLSIGSTTNNFYTITSTSAVWGNPGVAGSWSNKQLTSTASLSASSTSITTAQTSTLTPSLSSNTAYNVIKSTSYSVTTNPGSAGSVTVAGVFSASAAGTYTVTATVTYNAVGFTGITKTATATKSITVTAAAETTHSVTITYKCGSTVVSTQTSQNIGEVTAASITAPTVTGYTFSNWTLGTGMSNQSGSTTANPISVKTLGSGNYTMQANYTEDLSSPWTLKGGTNVTGDNWATAHALTKKTGHSTENVAYYTANISSTNSGISGSADAWSFKVIKDGSTWYGLFASGSYWWERGTPANQPLTGEQNIQICADVAGTYEIKVDYSTATPKVTVTFPTKYTVTYSVAPSGAADAITTSPNVTSGGSVAAGTSVTFTHAAANTGYTWYRWEDGSGSSLGTGSTYTTTINANTTVVAKYTENDYNVTVNAGTGGSVASGSVTGHYSTKVTLPTATANPGYYVTKSLLLPRRQAR